MMKDMNEIKAKLDTHAIQPSAQPGAGEPPGLHGTSIGESNDGLEEKFDTIREAISELEGRLQGQIRATEEKVMEYKEDVRNNIGGGHQEQIRLVNPKNTNVQKLSESFSHAEFTNWVEELYMHIEGTIGRTHSAPC